MHRAQRAKPGSRYSSQPAGDPRAAPRGFAIELPGRVDARVRRLPELLRDNAELRRRHANPLACGPVRRVLCTPRVALASLVPDDLAAIERPEERRMYRRCRPPCGRSCWARGDTAPSAFNCRAIACPRPAAASSKMRRTTAASASLMRRSTCDRWPLRADNRHVVVAEHAAAGDVAGARLAHHRVIGRCAPSRARARRRTRHDETCTCRYGAEACARGPRGRRRARRRRICFSAYAGLQSLRARGGPPPS